MYGNKIYQHLKRGIASVLAAVLMLQSGGSELGMILSEAAGESRSEVFTYYNSSNLLKPGASFPFYGKNHNRVGLWPYGLTNVNDNAPAAGFCLEPNKSMRTGTQGTLVTYDLDLDGDNLPLGLSREEAEILWYALSSSGNFEGYQTGNGKIGQGHYILGQAATWAIMSGEWNGLEDFREQMEVLLANLKSPQLAVETRGALEQFFNQTNGSVEEKAVPPFASKYQSTAPVHQMIEQEDGTYSITLQYSEGFDWRQSELEFEVPEGWYTKKEENGITFVCTTGQPDIGLVRGKFPEGSLAAQYWIKPNTFKIWYPDGWDETSAVNGKQAMITMAGEQEPWEVWLKFGKGSQPTPGTGSYEIPYTRYEHEETFERDYKIELDKLCDETGKPLEGSFFEVLEQFDFSQLDGTNLEEEQFREKIPTSEGKFEDMTVCEENVETDENGHFVHTDRKTYDYEKTYCGGHPEPVIHYVEVSDDATEEEKSAADEENARLEEEARQAWQECVDWCEKNCDFHSVDEGVARDAMEADRDEAWETFINLKRIYTVRETTARNGYILHDYHNDDIPIEIVEFSSSQAGGRGTVIGTNSKDRESATLSEHKTELVKAAATPSDASTEETEEDSGSEEEDSHEEETDEGKKEDSSESEETEVQEEHKEDKEDDAEYDETATPSNASFRLQIATPSTALYEVEAGIWEWDGVLEESEVNPIPQEDYADDETGYLFTVRDHRTEGELHINKRDMELYEEDPEGSYGKAQADATLEGAVYGLYAAEDLIHPDGKTGKVFSAGDLVSIATTDQSGDASFLVITEVSETSKAVSNRYENNEEENGNCWIGRPLLLGSYYVEEISRSEGYELSKSGKNLSESNRTGKNFVIEESGSASTEGFYHQINEWTEDSLDFTVDYYQTKGFDIILSGLPKGAKVYEVNEKDSVTTESVITGSQQVEKKDSEGNILYQTAEGGEYKLDADGNRIVKQDEEGNVLYSDEPSTKTVTAANRLNAYITSIERGEPSDEWLEESSDMDEDYILWETSGALAEAGYKSAAAEAPWVWLPLKGDTNGERIEEILSYCLENSLWDSYDVEQVAEKDGTWYAKIRYGYQALSAPVIYEPATGRLVIREDYEGGYYYAVYEAGAYEQTGRTFLVQEQTLDQTALENGYLKLKPAYKPLYETYAKGEYLLNRQGEKIPIMETVPVYTEQEVVTTEETLTPVKTLWDGKNGRLTAAVDTSEEDWGDAGKKKTYRVITEGEDILSYQAAVSVTTQKGELDEGSYVKYAVLLYPGQYEPYQDDETRLKPVIVEQRVIKQAIKVTKDIAEDSYENNTYKIHRDPFTVLFGGYNGKKETKTLPGFYFKLYLRSDLLDTGKLEKKEDGSYDYETFFKDNPDAAQALALEWDLKKYDEDGDMTTVHANRGGGKDDYWGESRMLPYGIYVLVEQQPTGIPQKHYQVDAPKEIELPFVPQVDEDGTVHDKVPSTEYLYDAQMTPEELAKRYLIRFNEESHIIKAHNRDGDFEVFKYGLEPDLARDCQNDTVAEYYHYGSISENAGTADGVYYETYYDRDGNLTDYGVTLDGVDTMTGKSTAVDRKYAKALVPWSVLDPRYGEVINDEGDIGNREPGLEDGKFNFISFANQDFENEFYSSRLRIEKIDSETGENIIHDGALFKIYAAKRDVSGDGNTGVAGTGDILFDENGIPLYDEDEQIFMYDETGAEVGIFKAYSTVRDGEVTDEEGNVHTEKQCVGYIETYQPLGAGAYVLVEVQAPEGYVKSKPIAFTVYSDKVEYYEDGDPDKKVQAVKYQYIRPIGSDGKTITEDMHQIIVKDSPTHIEIHKIEKQEEQIRYRVDGDEEQLKNRGDVELQYKPNGAFAGFGYVTRDMETSPEPVYVENATLTLYKGLKVEKTGEHEYSGVKVERNLFDSVIGIQAYETGVDEDIRETGKNPQGESEWDITKEPNPPVDLWYFDLEYDPTELDEETGILYGLDDWGNRVCMLDSETGMAYVTDEKGNIIVWPLDENGDKMISQSVDVFLGEDGKPTINTDLDPVVDENGLPIYYKDGGVTWIENEWITDGDGAFQIARVPQGAYILEETAAPLADGYVQSVAIGLIVQDTTDSQSFTMEDDFTKMEISKLDMTSREEIEGAKLTLYEAYRVYDDSDRGWHLEILLDSAGEPVIAESWVSEGKTPHWIDHIMPGDYILREERTPTAAGYVTADDVEVIIAESGEVQSAVMEDDHTAMEVKKVDAETGEVLPSENPAVLALYPAKLDEKGEAMRDEDGRLLYEEAGKIYEWITDDGSEVRKTAHQVTIPGGHSYIAYDYEIEKIPGTVQAICYVTETGAMRFEYLPVGKYVLVEKTAPESYAVAEPVLVSIENIGSKEQVQTFIMEDQPIQVLLTKVNAAGGKEIAGATVAVYRAGADGALVQHPMYDEEGNPLYLTDTSGEFLYDEDGNLIPAMEYDEAYLVERWISGSDGRYTKADEKNGQIPDGYAVGDLRLHELKNPQAGNYYFVEEQTPFGYVRAVELPFTITEEAGVQKFELVDELILGRLEIDKYDAEAREKGLAGAKFKFTNLDTNVATILITDEEGRAESSLVPIGSVGTDGTVSLYHFSVQEVGAPDGYLLEPEAQEFQFNVTTDRKETIIFHYEAADQPNQVVISKKKLTDKEELPGAHLEVRTVTETADENGQPVKVEGEVIESWVSGTEPHVIKRLLPGEYVLIETKAPDGFLEAEKVYFTVKEDMTVEEIPYVEMFDDDTKAEIRKADGETNEALAGAHLQMVRKETGEVIESWVTDETGSVVFQGLPAGEYQITELRAPDGYQLLEKPVDIVIQKDFEVQTFVIENQPTETRIEKIDKETRKPVEGAVLELWDSENQMAARWTTTKEPQVLKGLKPGEYLLKEAAAPEGYLMLKEPVAITITDQPGVQTVTLTNQQIETDIEKVDKETKEPLPGAKLRLVRDSDKEVIREWTSTKVPEVFKGLAPGSYTIEELSAPDGYAVWKEWKIEINAQEAVQKFALENEQIVTEFEKKDSVTGEPVKGAKLALIRNAGTDQEETVKEWVTDGKPFVLTGIPAGTYTIREIEAPEGYARMEDMVIEVKADAVHQTFTILNQPIAVEIEKVNNSGKLLGGAVLQLVRKSDGEVIREWTSKADQAEHFEKLPAGVYIVREVKAPSGYKKMEPREIEILAIKDLQEFTVTNYKITHSGGGGGGGDEKPKPEYMELYKTDGKTGERLANAEITVYRADGSVYYVGTTGPSGTVQFKKPPAGTYTFKETRVPEGYYQSDVEFSFTVKEDGTVDGDTTLENYKESTVVISKVDVTTAEELPGAEIEITDQDGNVVFHGVSDENGKVYFEAPEPGIYKFYEKTAPEGYDRNETVFQFQVFEDGTIVGDTVITDQKHYGTITASYDAQKYGKGEVTIESLLHSPKTGDSSHMDLLFLVWLGSASAMALSAFLFWKKRGGKKMKKAGMMMAVAILLAGGVTEEAMAAEVIEDVYEERQYTTTNPDSDEAEELFEKEIERDGVTYRLSEIRTELIEEQEGAEGELEIAGSPFLPEYEKERKPEETIEQDGISYVLKNARLEAAKIPAHEVNADEEVVYEAVEAADTVPGRIEITVTDEGTGQIAKTVGELETQEFSGERWEETFSFPATFHEYDLDGFWLGDNVFFLDKEKLDFSGYEEDLLELIHLSPKFYQVTSAKWAGEAYEDESGIRCRDAMVEGKKLVSDCTAVYEGTAVFPEEEGVRYIAAYERADGGGDEAKTYTMKAVGIYTPKKGNGALFAGAIVLGGAGAGTAGTLYYRKRRGMGNEEKA